MRLLFVGYRFFPERHAGDKTFWLELLRGMAARGVSIDVLSVDVRPPSVPPTFPLGLAHVPAFPVRMRDALSEGRYNPGGKEIEAITNYGSKSLTIPRLLREIRRRIRDGSYDGVHFMDNLGPAAGLIPTALGRMPCAFSAVTYNPRGVLYDPLLRASFAGADAVVAFSEAFARRLVRIGVPASRVRSIRWGVDLERYRPHEPLEGEDDLGVTRDTVLVAWTGFVQQTSPRDLETALRVARQVRGRLGSRVRFWFCFKPTHFRPEYERLREDGIEVTGDAAVFHRVQARADALLAPITEEGTILAPPLTWVEFLASGVPVFTLHQEGVDEAVVPGVGGIAESTETRLAASLEAAIRDPNALAGLRRGARATATERFDLRRSVDEYMRLWTDLAKDA